MAWTWLLGAGLAGAAAAQPAYRSRVLDRQAGLLHDDFNVFVGVETCGC